MKRNKTENIAFDKELKKLQNVVLFPKKLEMANQFIKKHGLPKEYYEQIARQKEEENKK